MKSLFLEGLQTARELINSEDGLEKLDQLIEEHEGNIIETAALVPDSETR